MNETQKQENTKDEQELQNNLDNVIASSNMTQEIGQWAKEMDHSEQIEEEVNTKLEKISELQEKGKSIEQDLNNLQEKKNELTQENNKKELEQINEKYKGLQNQNTPIEIEKQQIMRDLAQLYESLDAEEISEEMHTKVYDALSSWQANAGAELAQAESYKNVEKARPDASSEKNDVHKPQREEIKNYINDKAAESFQTLEGVELATKLAKAVIDVSKREIDRATKALQSKSKEITQEQKLQKKSVSDKNKTTADSAINRDQETVKEYQENIDSLKNQIKGAEARLVQLNAQKKIIKEHNNKIEQSRKIKDQKQKKINAKSEKKQNIIDKKIEQIQKKQTNNSKKHNDSKQELETGQRVTKRTKIKRFFTELAQDIQNKKRARDVAIKQLNQKAMRAKLTSAQSELDTQIKKIEGENKSKNSEEQNQENSSILNDSSVSQHLEEKKGQATVTTKDMLQTAKNNIDSLLKSEDEIAKNSFKTAMKNSKNALQSLKKDTGTRKRDKTKQFFTDLAQDIKKKIDASRKKSIDKKLQSLEGKFGDFTSSLKGEEEQKFVQGVAEEDLADQQITSGIKKETLSVMKNASDGIKKFRSSIGGQETLSKDDLKKASKVIKEAKKASKAFLKEQKKEGKKQNKILKVNAKISKTAGKNIKDLEKIIEKLDYKIQNKVDLNISETKTNKLKNIKQYAEEALKKCQDVKEKADNKKIEPRNAKDTLKEIKKPVKDVKNAVHKKRQVAKTVTKNAICVAALLSGAFIINPLIIGVSALIGNSISKTKHEINNINEYGNNINALNNVQKENVAAAVQREEVQQSVTKATATAINDLHTATPSLQ